MGKERNSRLLRTYGITEQEWLDKYNEQKGLCKICLKKQPILFVDHRHVKGYKKLTQEEKKKEVRGLCCFTCNVLLGKLEKRNNAREVLMRIVEYAKVYNLKGD